MKAHLHFYDTSSRDPERAVVDTRDVNGHCLPEW
jgi:hypothetical protein